MYNVCNIMQHYSVPSIWAIMLYNIDMIMQPETKNVAAFLKIIHNMWRYIAKKSGYSIMLYNFDYNVRTFCIIEQKKKFD